MARAIDADVAIKRFIGWLEGPHKATVYDSGFDDAIWRVLDVIEHMPTLTQPNEGAKDKNVPTNVPLTLEELREMDGDPVWGKSLITGKPGEWFILRVVEMSKTWFIACAGAEQGFGDKDTYGETWVAYRRPPEGGRKPDE